MMPKVQRTCVLKCKDNKHMHAFPKDEVSRNVWLKQLGIKSANATSFVCDRHFSSKMRPGGIGSKLTHCAIPDINLPNQRKEIESDEDMDMNISDVHLNGHANDSKIDDSSKNDDPMDFDVLLAKVHCISDFAGKDKTNNTESIDGFETDDITTDDEDMYSVEEYPSPVPMTINGNIERHVSADENTLSAPPTPVEINSKFKRKLIAAVRRRRILYDAAHPSFSNIEKKTRAWERIAKIQKLDATACRELWLNMRYDYQNHVRSLRQWLAGECYFRDRPRVQLENDLLFLWRHIADKSYCEDTDDESEQPRSVVCHVPGVPDTPSSRDISVIVNNYARTVDHPYANNQTDASVQFACNLIEIVKYYQELYDPMHPHYGDTKRKSIIWDAVSNELKEKATKCLYTWIVLQLRFEFEVIHRKSSYLVNKMEFLKKHILPNEKSPFKRSTTLTNEWFEPMNTVKEQHMMLQAVLSMKRYRSFFMNIDKPHVINRELKTPCWMAVARLMKRKAEQCEVTWIVMQEMYCEVAEFRRQNCLLSDEWEIEPIIINLHGSIVRKPSQFTKDPPPKPPANENNNIACDDGEVPGATPDAPPDESLNEIEFTLPAPTRGDSSEPRVVRFNLNTPIKDLPEKMIVEIDSVVKDAHIVVLARYKKGPLVFPFTLEKRRELIAEVMARPILFNQPCKYSRLARIFWGEISIEMGYPAEICMFFWEYITEKSYFVDYDPLWKKTPDPKWIPPPNPMFEKFLKYADSKNWGEYIAILPDFVQEISNFPLIYVDLKINSSWNRRQCHARDMAEVWSILARKFAVLENHKIIWDKLKQVFLQYMSEMELSIYNAWPKFWFRVLVKMRFLCELRYSPKDPIYFVIRNKIEDEIKENTRDDKALPAKLDPITNARAIFRLLKENEYLEDFTWLNKARFLAKMRSFPMLYDVSHPLFGNKEAKLDAWQEMALTFHCTVGECHLIFQHLMKSFLLFRARDPNQVCRVNAKLWENMTYIYSCAMPNAIDSKILEGRSFRPYSCGSTIKLAEEYQAEISLVDAKPRLILKNLAAAINSLPIQIQSSVVQQIRYIFAEYTRIQNEEIVVDV